MDHKGQTRAPRRVGASTFIDYAMARRSFRNILPLVLPSKNRSKLVAHPARHRSPPGYALQKDDPSSQPLVSRHLRHASVWVWVALPPSHPTVHPCDNLALHALQLVLRNVAQPSPERHVCPRQLRLLRLRVHADDPGVGDFWVRLKQRFELGGGHCRASRARLPTMCSGSP